MVSVKAGYPEETDLRGENGSSFSGLHEWLPVSGVARKGIVRSLKFICFHFWIVVYLF